MLDGQVFPSSKQSERRIIIEGWRFIPHSYAIVNQWQVLELNRRSDVTVKFVEVPPYRGSWKPVKGLFNSSDELLLQSLPAPQPDEKADVTFRISLPYNFSRSRSSRTAVFVTAETQALWPDQFGDPRLPDKLRQGKLPKELTIVTPSRWSAEAYLNAGCPAEQVLIVPHGVDTATFRPLPKNRDDLRRELSWMSGEFVFLSVGAMTGNKGIDLLLRAFCMVSREFPHARLVLKGLDDIFRSGSFLSKSLQLLSPQDRDQLHGRVAYLGGSFSNEQMARCYQSADVYVSPYRAEGFNMPVLEAAASGLPIICTRGGPTDEFLPADLARKIESQKVRTRSMGQEGWQLEPNLEHLTVLMRSAIEDHGWRNMAADEGPKHVRANYTWRTVVDTLMAGLFR
jgi:glycosyltransferase involved in cell wall biosynthesis